MRISGDSSDPGYHDGFCIGTKVRVFLDGDQLRNVITADDRLGMVIVYETDDRGHAIVRNDIFARKILHGNVRIVIPAQFKDLIPRD